MVHNNSLRALLVGIVTFFLITSGLVAPAQAVDGMYVSVSKSDVVRNGQTNLDQIVITFSNMPVGGRIQILVSGATYASTGSPVAISTSSAYRECGSSRIYIAATNLDYGAPDIPATCNTSGNYLEWQPNSGAANYGGKISFLVGAGALQFTSSTAGGFVYINGNRTYGEAQYDFTLTPKINSAVTFKANGGVGADYTQRSSSTTNLALNTFTRSGYRFLGWGAGQQSSVNYTDGASFAFGTSTADKDFYAIWQLSTPQAPLTVTSTSETFGNPLTLTSSGGSGNGAITYVAANGTASGCAITGGNLTTTTAGTCLVTATKASDTTYDSVSSVATTVTIAKASRTLSFGATTTYTLTYGATQTVLATPSAGAGDVVTYSVSSGTACSVDSTTGVIRVTETNGSCSVSASIAEGTNYLAASTTTQVVVNGTVKAITITGGSPMVNYGTSFNPTALDIGQALVGTQLLDYSASTFTYTGINGTSYGPSTTRPNDAGWYAVLPSNVIIETTGNVDTTANYNITYAPGALEIRKVSRTLAFSTTSASLVYGDAQAFVAISSAGDGSITYSAGSSTACSVNSTTGLVTVTSGSGSCSISADISAGTNHLAATATTPVTITVSARPITITASSPAVTVGDAFTPTFSVSSGTLAGSEAISSVTYRYAGSGSTSYTSSTTAPAGIGTYSVTPSAAVFSSGTATNYVITYAVGALTINNKLARTLTFATTSYTLEYGDSQIVSAAVSGGPFDGTVTYSAGSSTACSVNVTSGNIEVTSGVGTCVVSAAISEGTGYLGATTTTPVTVTVEPKALTITAQEISITFGGAITPEYEITQGALQNSDAISGVSYSFAGTGSTNFASSTTAPTGRGTYSITPSAAIFSAGVSANYAITYAAATLAISQISAPSATMTIDAPVGSRVLGATLNYSASGMQSTASYEITVRSTPQVLSSGVITGDSVNGTATVPQNLEAGWHTLTFVSTTSDGSAFSESMYFKVSSTGMLLSSTNVLPSELAYTGLDMSSMLLMAAVMLMLGLALTRMATRKVRNRVGKLTA